MGVCTSAQAEARRIAQYEDRFNRISWRLALRLGYGDYIEAIRALMNRFIHSNLLLPCAQLDEDPMTQPAMQQLRESAGLPPFGTVEYSVSIFGMVYLAVKPLEGGTPIRPIMFNGLLPRLYMTAVSQRYVEHFGTLIIACQNLDRIEQLLKRTVGMGERKKPDAGWVINETKRREMEAIGLVDPDHGHFRRQVYGQLAESLSTARNVTRGS
jgi:hypothetical protein